MTKTDIERIVRNAFYAGHAFPDRWKGDFGDVQNDYVESVLSNIQEFSSGDIITDGHHSAKVISDSEVKYETRVKYLHNDVMDTVNTKDWHLSEKAVKNGCVICGEEFLPEKPFHNICDWCSNNTI